ncbi:MAG: UTP--glucose-1-phosphate uridylyltransferase [Thermodesulfobacteriota bacterium]
MNKQGVEDQIRARMRTRGIGGETIEQFLSLVRRARNSESAYVPLDTVLEPDSHYLFDGLSGLAQDKALRQRGEELLGQAVVIKLNGGRSTTMGGEIPKGVLIAKNGLSYLEIIARQMLAFKRARDVEVPLVLMNSFFTHEPTLDVISRFDIPVVTFLQSQVPRLKDATWEPLDTGTENDWTPPGHGDVYTSLRSSGLLDGLLRKGYRWAFISNLDNLAGVLDPWILGLMDYNEIDFLLEVTDRTEVDRKGGTLVLRDGKLDLLEIAQVGPEERDAFMDIHRFRVFNTNNVWVDLKALSEAIDWQMFNLPVIQNRKIVAGTEVVQLETAMGAAVGAFGRARGLRVGRDRFFPTKKVEDLFLLQSDACVLDSAYRLQRNPERPPELSLRPDVVFEPDFLDSALRMDSRFEDPSSVSLVRAVSLHVSGPVYFERDVKVEGRVVIKARPGETYRIKQGTTLTEGTYP